MKEKTIIGRSEWCAFPDLHVAAIKARVDSGAKTSSIHAFNIETFERDDAPWVRFEVHPLVNDLDITIVCEQAVADKRLVKSSSGEAESRYVIRTPIQLAGKVWEVDLTLSNRDSMGHRMLLGREAMNGRLIIDPSLSCTQGRMKINDLKNAYKEASVLAAKMSLEFSINTSS